MLYPAHDAQPIENAEDGKDVAVILDVTAFHAEGGGQLGIWAVSLLLQV